MRRIFHNAGIAHLGDELHGSHEPKFSRVRGKSGIEMKPLLIRYTVSRGAHYVRSRKV
jgi:hypothetical protein